VPDFAFVSKFYFWKHVSGLNTNIPLVGQVAYNSSISLKEEFLPVPVDIVAAKGCDGMLFTLAEQLLAAGIIQIPKTGSLTY